MTSRLGTYQKSDQFMDPFISSQVDMADTPEPFIGMASLGHMAKLYVLCLIVSVSVLLYEILLYSLTTPRKQKQTRSKAQNQRTEKRRSSC